MSLEDETLGDEFYEEMKLEVDAKQQPMRLDKYVMTKLAKLSRNKVQNAIKSGAITINNVKVKQNHKVRGGDRIKLVWPKYSDSQKGIIPEDIPLNIIYEDQDVMVINKPAGMVVHPGVGHKSGTLVNALAGYFNNKELPVLPGNDANRIGLVHRIDKDTSGLLLIAKTEFSMTFLAKQFFDHSIERKYVALIWGDPERDKGTIVGNVGRHPNYRQKQTVFVEGDKGKEAITHWRVLERMYYVSLVECELETGRTHQIRVHMQWKGWPLFNDAKYDGNRIRKGTIFSRYKTFVENVFGLIDRQALHAKVLGFTHPTSGKYMRFESELPSDMEAAIGRWKSYVADRKSKLNQG